jgi:hypothetical protein
MARLYNIVTLQCRDIKKKEQIENSIFITWINKTKVCKQSIACFYKVGISSKRIGTKCANFIEDLP